ncbi:MAG: dihydrodipicolinate synthase family protein [Chthoniobacterales bacterium]
MDIRSHLLEGQAIPALPLALDKARKWSKKYQRALVRYYHAAGTGGLAVGVHSTQFEIRNPEHALFEPVLELASEILEGCKKQNPRPYIKIAGLCGKTAQAVKESTFAKKTGYDAGLLSMAAWEDAPEEEILNHCRTVSEIIPIIGFYLQTAVGGRAFSYSFWRKFVEIPDVVAIKMAPFNRYQTWDVVRAVMESGRKDVALYTGNDDNIINDLLTPWQWKNEVRFISGGLLGQWGVWTKTAVEMLTKIKQLRKTGILSSEWLTKNAELTDANAVIFDAANRFAGCIPGIHELLRRQGLLETNYCLNPKETLSSGQAEELDRICDAYPWLLDDEFVRQNLDAWLKD